MTQRSVDVALRGEYGRSLELKELHLMKGGSNYQCVLSVRSDGFQLERLFWFEPSCLQSFRVALAQLNSSLTGTAKLQPLFESDYVQVESASGGHVIVSGQIDADPQHLRFQFETDQSFVTPFMEGLKNAAQSGVAV